MEELEEALNAAQLDKGKRKVESDLSKSYDDYIELWDEAYPKLVNPVTRSRLGYQPSNLQAGGPSCLVYNGLFSPAFQRNVLEEDVI
ncbi:hypothetical protein RHMOL_Rhmol11G0053200 [Rhododendron molle]|uniref:Uncharacterized protein n=1 Tax=Rhododendron molle TaxID=49168 RepID=A0ACC0LP11_RHOML|nr:hypothetical protein RHMOL_Rhmol11G0053200 [Rhododendron molle]